MKAIRLASLLLLAACSGDDVLPPPEGPHVRYVVSDLKIPTSSSEARDFALDLNRDKTVDNQLGMIFGTLNGQGLGVAGTAREALLRGGLIMLADLQTLDFDDELSAGFTTFLGADPSPAPCTNAADLTTCGQHLQGTGSFTVRPDTGSTTIVGSIDDGTFLAGDAVLPVQLVIDDKSPAIRLDLHHARVELAQITEDHATAILAGGVSTEAIANVIIPQAQAQIDRIVSTECGVPDAEPPCGCVKNSRADTLQGLFDRAPFDCHISVEEIASNTLAQSLLTPDLKIDGEQFLSFGVGVELVRARFTPPLSSE